MKALLLVVYVVMAVWLLLASALRVALQLHAGADLDALPFIGGLLGLLALLLLLPAYDEWRQGHPKRPAARRQGRRRTPTPAPPTEPRYARLRAPERPEPIAPPAVAEPESGAPASILEERFTR